MEEEPCGYHHLTGRPSSISCKRSGDSLAGRDFTFHLDPVTLAELTEHASALAVCPASAEEYLRARSDERPADEAALDDFFLTSSVRPFTRNVKRSLLKAAKFYLYDWTRVADPGHRFENYVACELLCRARLWTDGTGHAYDLYYVRDKQKHETDFLITRAGVPWLLIEAKLSDQPVEGHHLVTAAALGQIPVVQVCRRPGIAVAQREHVFRMSADRLFA